MENFKFPSKNDHVLITGGAGFIGNHLARRLDNVDIIDEQVPDVRHCHFFHGELSEVLASYPNHPEVVFHLACDADIFRDNFQSYLKNVRATSQLLEWMVHEGIPNLIFASSSSVYGETTKPAKETDSLKPVSLYATSKVACETLIETCNRKYGLRYWTYRFSNVIGSGCRGLIPDILSQGSVVQLRGHGEQVRSYIHVSDVLDAFADLSRPCGTYNLSNDDCLSVSEVVRLLKPTSTLVFSDRRVEDLASCMVDSSRLKGTGWKPMMTCVEAVLEAAKSWQTALFAQ